MSDIDERIKVIGKALMVGASLPKHVEDALIEAAKQEAEQVAKDFRQAMKALEDVMAKWETPQ